LTDLIENKSTAFVRRTYYFLFILIVILSFMIRRHDLGKSSLWLDEVLQLNCTTSPFSELWSCSPQDKPPLDYYIQWFFIRGEYSEFKSRFHACIFGTLFVIFFGLWGRVCGGKSLSLIAMTFAMASPILIGFSRDGRPYALMLFSECLFLWFFWKIMLPEKPMKKRDLYILTAIIILNIWSLYWNTAICLFCGLYALMCFLFKKDWKRNIHTFFSNRKKWLPYAICFFLILLSIMPLIFRAQRAVTSEFYNEFNEMSWERIGNYLDVFAIGYECTQAEKGTWIYLIILALTGFLGQGVRSGRRALALINLFLFIIFFFGIFLFFMYINHWMEIRYTIAAFPPLLMLCAMGVKSLCLLIAKTASMISGKIKLVVFCIFSTLLSLLIAGYAIFFIWNTPLQRVDWSELARRLKKEASDDTIVIVANYPDLVMMDFYVDHLNISARVFSTDYNPEIVRKVFTEHDDVWVAFTKWWPPRMRDLLVPLVKEHPPIWGLDTRRKMPSSVLAFRRPELKKTALNCENNILIYYPFEKECPYHGKGWGPVEDWGDSSVRGLDGPVGEVFFFVKESVPLFVTFWTCPFSYESSPPLELKIIINGRELESSLVENGWHFMNWEISEEDIKIGLNVIELVPNRILSPSEMYPDNEDYRELSLYLKKVRIKLECDK
jgi:hypothetical protein